MGSLVVSVACAADPAEMTPAGELKVWTAVRSRPAHFPIPPKMSWETLEIVDVDPTGTLDRWKREGNQK